MSILKSFFGTSVGGTASSEINEDQLYLIKKKQKDGNTVLVLDGSKEQTISGIATVQSSKGKHLSYQAITVELLGYFSVAKGSSSERKYFLSEKYSLGYSNTIYGMNEYEFGFKHMSFPYESYDGTLFSIKYSICITIERAYGQNIVNEHFFEVYHPLPISPLFCSTTTNVGMKDVIQASVSLDRTTFTCNDVLTGSLVVTESLLHIKQVFLTLVKKEICYSSNPSKTVGNMKDVCSMEVTDGSIALGTSFPFRFFLDDTQHVSPSYDSIGNRFTLEWYLKFTFHASHDNQYYFHIPIDICRGNFQKTY